MVQPPWRQETCFGQALERAGHAMATVTIDGLGSGGRSAFLLVFGGRRGNTLFSDVLAFDVARHEWSVWCERWPSAPRSYHTATVVNGEVWLCGGGNSSQVLPDVLVFNPADRSWRQAELRGDVHLLKRTAHGACIHPLRPSSILMMGGYGGPADDLRYLNDLVEIDTVAGTVRAVQCIGSPPELRAYHAFVACGSRCYCVAGRMHDNRLVKGKQIVVVWDANTSKWIVPGMVEGELPPRSSHRMAAVPGGMLAFGGAVDRGAKSAELHLLTGQGRLSWRACQLGATGPVPAARGAHAMEIVGGRLYVVGGYGEVADLQRQLQAAQQEGSKAESELLELRSQQRRERDRAEREAMEKDRRVQQLEQELQAERGRNDRLSETVAQNANAITQLQHDLREEQQRASKLRVTLADERESLNNALRDEQDKARQAAQQRDHCQMQLESEQRQLREAKEMIERQQAQVREAEEKARQVQEECRRARDEAEEARRQKNAAEEAAGRARAALGRIQRARELLQQAEDDMAALGT
ncbi:hypothetical protein ABPG75_009715 [Micractinium tetrahymenae]